MNRSTFSHDHFLPTTFSFATGAPRDSGTFHICELVADERFYLCIELLCGLFEQQPGQKALLQDTYSRPLLASAASHRAWHCTAPHSNTRIDGHAEDVMDTWLDVSQVRQGDLSCSAHKAEKGLSPVHSVDAQVAKPIAGFGPLCVVLCAGLPDPSTSWSPISRHW
jgi:hypothetical protein